MIGGVALTRIRQNTLDEISFLLASAYLRSEVIGAK